MLLILGITETTAMRDAAKARKQLESLKALGVRLAIDDFGTRYSSLLQLRRFPIDTLKIDHAFVGDMTQNLTDHAIVTASINLAKALDLEVVAEGSKPTSSFKRYITWDANSDRAITGAASCLRQNSATGGGTTDSAGSLDKATRNPSKLIPNRRCPTFSPQPPRRTMTVP